VLNFRRLTELDFYDFFFKNGRLKNDTFWYRYIYPKNLNLFSNEKLVAPEISLGGNFSYDENGEFYSTTTIYGYIKKNEISESYKSLMALCNSKLFWWYLVNTGTVLSNNYFRFKPNYVKPFPLPLIPIEIDLLLQDLTDKILHAKEFSEKESIPVLESEIDDIVFDLYGLTIDERNEIKTY
jgi:hypothetical protein